uniref:Kelch domain-containing protein 10 n=1 Tax=Meloidogyne floridensis TaxID=298350 RepID=A0A915NXD8_9BILA
MSIITVFPTQTPTCSLSAFLRKKQRRKNTTSSLELNGENHISETLNPVRGFRRRLVTVGPILFMRSNQKINKNPQDVPIISKKNTAILLNNFKIVQIFDCKISNKIIPSRRLECCNCCPIARSGHRIFADFDFIYVLGGYNYAFNNDKTYTDVWRFNRLTNQWQQCSLFDQENPLPNTLASFSLVPVISNNSQNEIFIFGGTGFPFGQKATIYLPNNQNLLEEEYPPRMYGHAMCHRIELNSDGSPYQRHGFEPGRYRLEAVLHGQKIFTFGGGAPDFCAEFNEVLVFNISERKFEHCPTIPDSNFGFPLGRKCHSLVQLDDDVYIIGGCRDNLEQQLQHPHHHQLITKQQLLNDVWRFNLNNLKWKKLKTNLPIPVYFHSSTLTKDGCVYVFGGCVDEDPLSQTRVNCLQKFWLKPPSLRYFASNALIENMEINQKRRIFNNFDIKLSDSEALISAIFKASVAA